MNNLLPTGAPGNSFTNGCATTGGIWASGWTALDKNLGAYFGSNAIPSVAFIEFKAKIIQGAAGINGNECNTFAASGWTKHLIQSSSVNFVNAGQSESSPVCVEIDTNSHSCIDSLIKKIKCIGENAAGNYEYSIQITASSSCTPTTIIMSSPQGSFTPATFNLASSPWTINSTFENTSNNNPITINYILSCNGERCQDSIELELPYCPCPPCPTSCDSISVSPFPYVNLQLSGRTFKIQNMKVPSSPICSVKIEFDTTVSHQGGGLIIDGTPSSWSSPYNYISLSPHADNYVQFNLGVDYTINWVGTVNLTIYHCDGDSCLLSYGTWEATPPSPNPILVDTVPMLPNLIASKIKFRPGSELSTHVKYLAIYPQKPITDIFAVSAPPLSPDVSKEGNSTEFEHIENVFLSKQVALFEFDKPYGIREAGLKNLSVNIVMSVSDTSISPSLRWILYDETGKAIYTDTLNIETGTVDVKSIMQNITGNGLELIKVAPNPAGNSVTIYYVLDNDRKIKLELYNDLGNLETIIGEGIRARGLNTIKFNTSNLQSGAYYIRLSGDGNFSTIPLLIIK